MFFDDFGGWKYSETQLGISEKILGDFLDLYSISGSGRWGLLAPSCFPDSAVNLDAPLLGSHQNVQKMAMNRSPTRAVDWVQLTF